MPQTTEEGHKLVTGRMQDVLRRLGKARKLPLLG
jgi:hypothetical protein